MKERGILDVPESAQRHFITQQDFTELLNRIYTAAQRQSLTLAFQEAETTGEIGLFAIDEQGAKLAVLIDQGGDLIIFI